MFTSAKTSVNKNKVPAIFKKIHWTPYTYISNPVNLDYGGGKYDTATRYLYDNYHIINLILDPYNRTNEENIKTIELVNSLGGVNTATCSNVLNVIQDKNIRAGVIINIYKALKHNGEAYFSVYEGDKSGIGRQTGKDQWQENRKLGSYVSEIHIVLRDMSFNFGIQQHKGMIYVCKKD